MKPHRTESWSSWVWPKKMSAELHQGVMSSHGNKDALAITCGENRSTLISEMSRHNKLRGPQKAYIW